MERKQANQILAAIVTTIAECKEAPEGVLYAALMNQCDLSDFQSLLHILIDTGYADSDSYLVTLTDNGYKLADKINASIQKHQNM